MSQIQSLCSDKICRKHTAPLNLLFGHDIKYKFAGHLAVGLHNIHTLYSTKDINYYGQTVDVLCFYRSTALHSVTNGHLSLKN